MFDLGGTYRAVSAEETLAKVEPMLWDKFGITRVANVTGLDNINIPTYVAVRPRSTLLTTAQGKGINHVLAKVSAIMESIEGWHSEQCVPVPDLFGSYNALKNRYSLVDLDEPLGHGPVVCNQQVKNLEIPWVRTLELNSGMECYIPQTLVNMNTVFHRPGYRYFPPSTNGLASGNTFEEAVCHALFEVIERECEAHFDKYSGASALVDLASINVPHIKALLAHLDECNLHLEVTEITDKLQIPTFCAYLDDRNDVRSVGKQRGSGSHWSSVVALSRAITEAVQTRATVISGARDDIFPAAYQRKKVLCYEDNVHVKQKTFIETSVFSDFSNGLDQVLQRLKQHGYPQVLVYNLTRQDLGIPVVHVVVPGLTFDILRHINNG